VKLRRQSMKTETDSREQIDGESEI
jgi:hypothetical protein